MGKEVGEEGTRHLQGACVIGRQMDFSSLKKILGLTRAHIEPMRGQPHQSLAYCSKSDANAFQFGALPQPGNRTDLHTATDLLKTGATMLELADVNPVAVVKFSRGLMYLRSLLSKPRDSADPPKIYWLYGPTGCGKSRFAHVYGMAYTKGITTVWTSSSDLRWFDGYDGQKVVIFDDFRPKEVSFSFLLRLTDRYPFRVPFKGGFVNWCPEVIFITTPYDPDRTFEYRATFRSEDVGQLKRRITRVFDVSNADDSAALDAMYTELVASNGPILSNEQPDNESDVDVSNTTNNTNVLENSEQSTGVGSQINPIVILDSSGEDSASTTHLS